MGLNNYLKPPGGDPVPWIQYKHGYCRELSYQLGDTIEWDGGRPEAADGGVTISGVYFEVEDGRSINERFFNIRLLNDKLVSFEEVSEAEYDRLENPEYDLRIS